MPVPEVADGPGAWLWIIIIIIALILIAAAVWWQRQNGKF